MKCITKYELSIYESNLLIPYGAKFLHCELQYNKPTLWFEVDNEKEIERRVFRIILTGGTVPGGFKHLQTVLNHNGTFTQHIYEQI